MKVIIVILAAFLVTSVWAEQKDEKLAGTLAKDGFPTGQDTPEGVACDLARAFIDADVSLWQKITIRKYMGGENAKKYADFLESVEKQMAAESKKKPEERAGPRKIEKCFESRHLSKDGPASYGYASFDFQDVMFVDIDTSLPDGKMYSNRTLVIKDKDGKWFVHPMPLVSPLLCAGLNEESDSKKEFGDKKPVKQAASKQSDDKKP